MTLGADIATTIYSVYLTLNEEADYYIHHVNTVYAPQNEQVAAKMRNVCLTSFAKDDRNECPPSAGPLKALL